MHFTVLYFKENVKLEDTSLDEIAEEFSNNYCCCCGETEPEVQYVCDWFQVGGRWCDILKASKGIKGDNSWFVAVEPKEQAFSAVEIADLDEDFLNNELIKYVYAVATPEEYEEKYERNEYFWELYNKIKTREVNGVIVLFDCHD